MFFIETLMLFKKHFFQKSVSKKHFFEKSVSKKHFFEKSVSKNLKKIKKGLKV